MNAHATKSHISIDALTGRILNSTPGFNRKVDLYDLNANVNWEIAARLEITSKVAESYITIRTLQARITVGKELASTQTKLVSEGEPTLSSPNGNWRRAMPK